MSDGDTEMNLADGKCGANKAQHRTAIPLRSIAGELDFRGSIIPTANLQNISLTIRAALYAMIF